MIEFFLDTADISCLEHWKKTGFINGVTTNPSNLSATEKEPWSTIKKIITLFDQYDVSVQITDHTPQELYTQAHEIAELGTNVVVKIPCLSDYFSTIKKLAQEKIKINITLVFSPLQATIMANFGVTYVSPFVGRLEDDNQDGILLIKNIRHIFNIHNTKTKILAASLRTTQHVQESILAGADCVTLPPLLCQQIVDHHLTAQGIKKFECDWQKIKNSTFPL